MNKNFVSYIKKAADKVTLSPAERARMKTVLQSYMRFNPAPQPVTTYTRTVSWIVYLHRPLAAALVLVLVSTTGISYAAESALPGDILYTVKTKMNESVKVAFAANAEAKAEVHMQLAERRIEEATSLAAEGRLDEATQESLAVAFASHAETAASEIEKVETEDAAAPLEMTSRFETRLAAHNEVFALVRESKETETPRSSRLAVSIRDAGTRVAGIRTRTEEKLAVSAAFDTGATLAVNATMSLKAAATPETATSEEMPVSDRKTASRMQDAAEKQLKTAQKKVRSSEKNFDAETRVQAYNDLEYAEALIEDGRELLDDDSVALAFHAFQESLIISERLQVIAKTAPVAAKARSSRRDASAHTETRLSETRPTATSGKGGIGNAEVDADLTLEATSSARVDLPTTEVEVDVPMSKFIPPSIQIFSPHWDDNEDEDNNHDDNESKGKGSGIKLDISL